MDALVTIRSYQYAHEMAIVKGKLESEGIDCYTIDELITQIAPFYSFATGGVKLQVKESDVDRANNIINEATDEA